jgi:hypothetical protein
MKTITITKTITQPEDVINQFADDLGYQTIVVNPDFVEAQGSEQIVDPTWEQPADFNPMTDTTPMVPNPDYVPQVGERTMPNPQSRVEFVSEKFDDFVSDKFFGQFARRNAERAALATVEQTVTATKEAIKATIVTIK